MSKSSLIIALAAFSGVALPAAYIAGTELMNPVSSELTPSIITGMGGIETNPTDPSEGDTSAIEWLEISLDTPGSLGVEVLYKVDVLTDVTALRVSGTLNDADWTTIKNMSNLLHLDMSGAITTSMPAMEFQKAKIRTILLPPTLVTIGEYAFNESDLTEITIPKNVASIGSRAFNTARQLTKVEFAPEAPITSIPGYCFDSCSALQSVKLSDAVTSIGYYGFSYCSSLQSINLPDGLKSIGSYAFYNTKSLASIVFPESLSRIEDRAFYYSAISEAILPRSMSFLADYSFSNNNALTKVSLPANLSTLTRVFPGCPNIKEVICPAATPIQAAELFTSGVFGNATLTVPDFAVVNYKLDTYWMQFATIQGGVTADNWNIFSDLSLTNNRRIEGTPSIKVEQTGRLLVGGTAPMPMNDFAINCYAHYNSSSSAWGQLINNSPAMMANTAMLEYAIYGGYWNFVSLPFDVKRSDITVDNAEAQFVVRSYDGANRGINGSGSNWKDLAADDILRAGQGYIIQTDRTCTLKFPALGDSKAQYFKYSEWTTPLEENPSATEANAGWNLVGNPYMSHYDLYYTYQTSPVTLWNRNNRNYVAYSLLDDEVVITPLEAFFVQYDAETLKNLTFNLAGRQFDTTPVQKSARRKAPAASKRSIINLEITSESGHSAQTRIVLNPDASEEYESNCDASKFFSPDELAVELYSLDAAGNAYAINERPEGNGNVGVGFRAPKAGSYTIAALRSDCDIELYDSQSATTVNLSQTPYTFDSAEGYDDHRFILRAGKGVTTGIDAALTSEILILPIANGLSVNGADGLPVEVYSISGIKTFSIEDAPASLDVALAKGVYIIKVGQKVSKCVVK